MTSPHRRQKRKPQQGVLPFRQRGGRRPGAGRKPKGERAGVGHGPRALLKARFPAHVTLKLLKGLPRLRSKNEVHVHAVIDTFTSAPWFDGFRERVTVRGLDKIERPITDARSWMLTIGWRRHGLLSVHDLPATG